MCLCLFSQICTYLIIITKNTEYLLDSWVQAEYIHIYVLAPPTHTHTHTQFYTFECKAPFSDTKKNFLHNHTQRHTHTDTHCCDPREQASCVCAGAVTPVLIINQWANCKRTKRASLAHMTSSMHVNIHRVYKPFKVPGPLQYSWLIITDGRHTQSNTLHWYWTMIQTQT